MVINLTASITIKKRGIDVYQHFHLRRARYGELAVRPLAMSWCLKTFTFKVGSLSKTLVSFVRLVMSICSLLVFRLLV